METKIKNIMSALFKVPIEDIDDDFSAHLVQEWDSLKHVDLVLSLEKEFHIKFDNEEIPTMINYKMIVNTVQSYLE